MNTADRDESLLSTHERLVSALGKNDATSIVSLYADDIVFMAPNDQSIYGKEEVLEWWTEYITHFKINRLVEIERSVTMLGEWAIERWVYAIDIHPTAGGDRILDEGRVLLVWKQSADSEWQITQQIWNSTRPIGSGTSRFMSLLKKRWNVSGTDS